VEFEDVGQGKPVVLLHAMSLGRNMWRPQIAALQKDYRLLAPDLRGFGGTEGFKDKPSLELMAEDVDTLLTDLGVTDPVAMVGQGLGASVALDCYRRRPERIRGLALVEPRVTISKEIKGFLTRMIAFTADNSAGDLMELMLPKFVSLEVLQNRPEVVQEIRELAHAQSREGIIGALTAWRDQPDQVPIVKTIKLPTVVLTGSINLLTEPGSGAELTKMIPNAKHVTIRGAAQMPSLEKSDLFNEALRSFLQGLS
jgi:pimeloyl-ACP methyl ester carboxylesterase